MKFSVLWYNSMSHIINYSDYFGIIILQKAYSKPEIQSNVVLMDYSAIFLILIGRLSRIRDIIYFTRGRMSHIRDKIFMEALRS